MALQKDAIVAKALEILNRDGLDGVTLRRVAAELNVQAASLYWHVRNKRELLDEMADEMLRSHFLSYETPDPTVTSWQIWLLRIAQGLREVLLSYRDGGLVVAGVNPNRAKTFARLGAFMLTTLRQTYGLQLELAGIVCATVVLYTWASVIEEQTSPSLEELVKNGPAILQYLPPTMIADMSRLTTGGRTALSFFTQGVELIIAGAERTMQDSTDLP